MWKAILRDRAIRGLPAWLPGTFFMGALTMAGHRAANVHDGMPHFGRYSDGFIWVSLALWFLMAAYFLYAEAPRRCGRWETTLPIPARRLWLVRTLAFLMAQCFLVVLPVLIHAVGNQVTTGRFAVAPDLRDFWLHALPTALLVLALIQSWRLSLFSTPASLPHVIYVVALIAGGFLLAYFLSALSPVTALIPASLALGLFWSIHRRLPATFQLVPDRPDPGAEGEPAPAPAAARLQERGPSSNARVAPPVADVAAIAGSPRVAVSALVGSGGDFRWILLKTIWQTFFRHWAAWAFGPILIGFAALAAGPFGSSTSLTGPVYIVVAVAMLTAISRYGLSRLHLLDPLPLRRGFLFANLTLPPLLVTLLVCTIFTFVGRGGSHCCAWHKLIEIDKRPPIAHELLDVAWSGHPPALTSPWGESHTPWSTSLGGPGTPALYIRFDAPPASSTEFTALQIERALTAVVGRPSLGAEFRQRYLDRAAATGGERWLDWWQELEARGLARGAQWQQTLPVILALLALGYLLHLALSLRITGRRGEAAYRLWAALSLGLPMVLWAALHLWTTSTGFTASWKVTALSMVLVRQIADVIPAGAAGAWFTLLVVFVLGYLLARSQFSYIEHPLLRSEPQRE